MHDHQSLSKSAPSEWKLPSEFSVSRELSFQGGRLDSPSRRSLTVLPQSFRQLLLSCTTRCQWWTRPVSVSSSGLWSGLRKTNRTLGPRFQVHRFFTRAQHCAQPPTLGVWSLPSSIWPTPSLTVWQPGSPISSRILSAPGTRDPMTNFGLASPDRGMVWLGRSGKSNPLLPDWTRVKLD